MTATRGDGGIHSTLRDLGGKVLRAYVESGGVWSWEEDHVDRDGEALATIDPAATKHLHLDHLGTIRLITSSTGSVLATHTYYPFGQEATSTTQDAERMKFTGQERDLRDPSNTTDDLDYLHARYATPNLGRFLSTDPIRGNPASPQSWNMYAYVGNNPVGRSDPTGMISLDDYQAAQQAKEAGASSVWQAIRRFVSGIPMDVTPTGVYFVDSATARSMKDNAKKIEKVAEMLALAGLAWEIADEEANRLRATPRPLHKATSGHRKLQRQTRSTSRAILRGRWSREPSTTRTATRSPRKTGIILTAADSHTSTCSCSMLRGDQPRSSAFATCRRATIGLQRNRGAYERPGVRYLCICPGSRRGMADRVEQEDPRRCDRPWSFCRDGAEHCSRLPLRRAQARVSGATVRPIGVPRHRITSLGYI
jgi:RHS repeat-associated protein